MTAAGTSCVLERVFREEWGRLVAALIKYTRDWDLAEECAQDAFSEAARRWATGAAPANPGAWLMTVARNRAIDRLRSRARQMEKLPALAASGAALCASDTAEEVVSALHDFDGSRVPDERLELMFTCCHPALALDARVALTLRSLAGLTTAEIARAFLVTEATMAKRLVRAKEKIHHAHIPFRVPPPALRAERLPGVLAVIYLLFNEGYSASAGDDLVRSQLCEEAVRLGRMLATLVPAEPEVAGLLALMLLQCSRQAARTDAAGDVITLEDQDRSLWDRADIDEGLQHLARLPTGGSPGPYEIQARIAACHARAERPAHTDWVEITALYEQLLRLNGSAVVRLNLAVATAMSEGPEAGLRLVRQLEARGELVGYHLLPAVHADLLRRLGRTEEAARYYENALTLVGTEPERRFLTRRLAEL